MNGPSKELLPLKTKVGKVKRSLDDQKFENVFYGIPYSDDSENDTICSEPASIGYGGNSKAEKSASSNNELGELRLFIMLHSFGFYYLTVITYWYIVCLRYNVYRC